jgi:hypothetical protein
MLDAAATTTTTGSAIGADDVEYVRLIFSRLYEYQLATESILLLATLLGWVLAVENKKSRRILAQQTLDTESKAKYVLYDDPYCNLGSANIIVPYRGNTLLGYCPWSLESPSSVVVVRLSFVVL